MRYLLMLSGAALLTLLHMPLPTAAQSTGSIAGTVTLRDRPPNRLASRYTGAVAAGTREMPDLPAVVYLVGKVGGAAPAPRKLELAQRDTAFHPNLLILPRGSTVAFPNQDPFFHNVFSFSKPKRFDLGRYPRNESKTVEFDKAGVVKVYCEVHKWMRAAVIISENPYHAVVDGTGRFRIDDLPPGRYTVAVWHMDRAEKTTTLTVSAGGIARLDTTL